MGRPFSAESQKTGLGQVGSFWGLPSRLILAKIFLRQMLILSTDSVQGSDPSSSLEEECKEVFQLIYLHIYTAKYS